MIAALAVLIQLKREVARVETKALDQLASLEGAMEFRIDRVEVLVSPEYIIVAIETPYRAKNCLLLLPLL